MTAVTTHSTQAVYRAENVLWGILDRSAQAPTIEFHGSTLVVPVERRFGDLAGVQRYADVVLALDWVRSEYPRARTPITVRARQGAAKAHYEHPSTIAIPVPTRATSPDGWALREMVVLHETAHHLTSGHGHDEVFAGCLVALVERIVGPEAGFLLSCLLRDEGVRIG